MRRIFEGPKASQEALCLIAILTGSTLLRLSFLHEPFERDEGHYAAIAQEILRGGIPYRDAIEIKPPGVFYLYAIAIDLFGASTEAIRIFTALYALLTIVAVYAVARRIAGGSSGLCAALVYGVFSTLPFIQGSSSNTEVFLVLPITAAVWFTLKGADTGWFSYFVWSGLCSAVALLIKPVAIPCVVLIGLFSAFAGRARDGLKEAVRDAISYLLPVVALPFVVLGYFALNGALGDFVYWAVEFPLVYRDADVSGPSLQTVLPYLAPALVVPTVLAVIAIPWLVHRKAHSGWLALGLVPAACLAVALPGKNFVHYFIILIPFLAIPAGIGLAHMMSYGKAAATVCVLAVLCSMAYSTRETWRLFLLSPAQVSLYKYGPTFVIAENVARYLRERTRADDYVFQWGFEPELYFLSGRRSPSPHLVNLTVGWSRNPEAAIQQLETALIQRRPAYIVIQSEWSNRPGVNEVISLVNRGYVLDRNVPLFGQIFRRSDIPS